MLLMPKKICEELLVKQVESVHEEFETIQLQTVQPQFFVQT